MGWGAEPGGAAPVEVDAVAEEPHVPVSAGGNQELLFVVGVLVQAALGVVELAEALVGAVLAGVIGGSPAVVDELPS